MVNEMPLSEIPTIDQLRQFKQHGKCSGLSVEKTDILKSAIVGLKLNGDFLGFGTVDRPTPVELERFRKESVSKSATDSELNDVFDDERIMPVHTPIEIQKSSLPELSDNSLEGIFPQWLQNN